MNPFRNLFLIAVSLSVLASPGVAQSNPQEVQDFLDRYTTTYLNLYKVASEAEWASNTVIIEGVQTIDEVTKLANEALSQHTGSVEVIEAVRGYLAEPEGLTPLQVKQLNSILYTAANSPQTVPQLVKDRIAAENKQNSDLFGFTFTVDGQEITPNEIDRRLEESTDLKERKEVWVASKEVGRILKDGLANLVGLRNETVQNLGYDDYFSYQVADYGMTTSEMVALNQKFVKELWPLYRELHTWARYELAERYGAGEVPDMLPADWLPNRWGQDWSPMVKVKGLDLDAALAAKEPEWLLKQAEAFYVSLGFEELPESFYTKSSLYPVDPTRGYKKNTHASAWHMDLDKDVRSLMSVEPNSRWYETTHHELGHIYYYMEYTNPNVPPLLRGGANRAFHEGVGSLLGMASMQKPFLVGIGLIDEKAETDEMQQLLKEALAQVVFIPFSAGTMTHFERDLYAADLPRDQYNARWWKYVENFQGIVPPGERGEEYADAATKTHINNDAAQYYDYALSYIILHQLHAHIANEILEQNPRATNYFGNKEVGEFLSGILKQGAVGDWREIMKSQLGQEISAKPMLDYYQPLVGYLKEQNQGRRYTLPETPSF
ncbi:MAG: M2 family metallopeptidase [Vulcanimicrobiota bacterium]